MLSAHCGRALGRAPGSKNLAKIPSVWDKLTKDLYTGADICSEMGLLATQSLIGWTEIQITLRGFNRWPAFKATPHSSERL